MIMGKTVGLDVGDVRIGIAVCDEMRLIASPHSVYRRVGFGPDVKHIKALCDQLGTRDIVCGLPRNMDGSIGFQAQKVQALAEQLANAMEARGYVPGRNRTRYKSLKLHGIDIALLAGSFLLLGVLIAMGALGCA